MAASPKFQEYVVARVSSGEQLDALVQALESNGFDRAQLSVLSQEGAADPFEHDREAIETPDDRQQFRVLVTSMSATVAGLASAGIAAAVTGGLAVPAIVAGAVAAGGVATISEAVGVNYEKQHQDWVERQMAAGGVVLHISAVDDGQRKTALALAKKHCGNAVLCSRSDAPD